MESLPLEVNIIESIKYDPLYRGQLIKKNGSYFNGYMPPLDYGLIDPFHSFLEYYKESKGFDLFRHQQMVIKRILDNKDTLISLCRGSGVRYAIDAAVIYRTIFNAHTTVYITKTNNGSTSQRFLHNCDLLSKSFILDLEETNFSNDSEILVQTPEDLIKSIRGFSESSFLSRIDHIVIEDIHQYNFIELNHLIEIIRVVKMNKYHLAGKQLSVQLTITTHPVENKKDLASLLIDTSDQDSIISLDDSQKNPFSIYYWLPPLETEFSAQPLKQFTLKRTSYYKDIELLFTMLNRCHLKLRVLLWRNWLPFTSHEKLIYHEAISKIKTTGKGDECLFIDVVDNLNQLSGENFRSYDVIISIAAPEYIDLLPFQLGNLANSQGAIVFMIMEETYRSTILLNSSKYSIESRGQSAFRLPKVFYSHNDIITYYYFLLGLNYVYSGLIIDMNEIKKIYSEADIFISKLQESKLIKAVASGENPNRFEVLKNLLDTISEYELAFGALDNNDLVTIKFDDASMAETKRIERGIGEVFFQNSMLVFINDKYYKVNWVKDDELLLRPQSDVNYLCIPQIILIKAGHILDKIKDRSIISHNNGISVSLQTGDLSIILAGFKSFSYPSISLTPVENANKKNILLPGRSYLKIELISDKNYPSIQEIVILTHQYFSARIKGIEKHIIISHSDDSVIIAPLFISSERFIHDLYNLCDDLFDYLKNFVYDQLLNCVCQNGCPLCLKSIYYPDTEITKNSLLLWLGKIKDEEESTWELVENRTKGVPETRIKNFLVYWKDKTIELFRDKYNMKIESPAPIYVVDKLESNYIGLYDGSVKILKSIGLEKNFTEVIAHEYAHNWQFTDGNMHQDLLDKSLPYEGKIFIEGFAQWVAFRTMDYYGLLENMSSLVLRGVDVAEEGDEYGVGFSLCRFIEEKYTGFMGLIRFMNTAKICDPESGEEISIHELLFNKFHIQTWMGEKKSKET